MTLKRVRELRARAKVELSVGALREAIEMLDAVEMTILLFRDGDKYIRKKHGAKCGWCSSEMGDLLVGCLNPKFYPHATPQAAVMAGRRRSK